MIAQRAKLIQNPSLWLVGILSGIAALQLMLLSRYGTDGFFTITLLFWGVVGYMLWEKFPSLELCSSPGATLCGGVLLGLSLVAALGVIQYPSHLIPVQILMFSGGISWCLLASGFSGLKQHRQVIGLLFFASFPEVFLRLLPINLPLITAKFTAFCLWYAGFKVSQDAALISLPEGSIFVFPDCSGIESMAYLWSLAVLMSTFLGFSRRFQILLSVCGILIGFVINGIRVGLLAIFVAARQSQSFDFWHEGSGSLIFSGIGAILISGISGWFYHLQNKPQVRSEPDWQSEFEAMFGTVIRSNSRSELKSELSEAELVSASGVDIAHQPEMEKPHRIESELETDAVTQFEFGGTSEPRLKSEN